ncbi:MAG TPA: type I DNA topoisomerase, partial [Candidatus Moranbacteria bacterium]|nr:type I DNA topoisomerase [Candidatus Moranbacteria bacterium]
MKLVIVESPTKAKTISKFLGKDYKVLSSFGHVRDLPKSKMGIDTKNNFELAYEIPEKAKKKVAELKKIVKKSDGVILATDEDREGEAIAWHLVTALDLNKKQISGAKRIVFHEITKKAIEKALESPRDIDINLVNAQQARRVLDRLVGYELSPFLWKKIKLGLSAGRVQSVALRFISEREREIEKFKSEEYYTISSKLKAQSSKYEFDANLIEKDGEKIEQTVALKLFAGDYKTKKTIINNKKAADAAVKDLNGAEYKVASVVEREIKRNPPAPFTTSTLQQTAINAFGFSSKQTMMIAQQLYEQGYITYMRTDSFNLSMESMLSAKKVIENKFGKEYALDNPRFYKKKSKGAQEAHEAIRPSSPEKTLEELQGSLDPKQSKLYRLIWNRMIACQMQPATLNSVKVDITASVDGNQPKAGQPLAENKYLLRANGSTIKFDGFLKVYGDKMPVSENILPPMKVGDVLDLSEIIPEQKNTTPPPRYNEASLVKVLEENGIGRPSTYAPTISTIIDRKYIEKNEERKLRPMEIGLVVNDLLVEHFPEIVEIKFTAHMEEELDEVAEGKLEWVPVVKKFYEPFHKHLEEKTKKVKKEDVLEKL